MKTTIRSTNLALFKVSYPLALKVRKHIARGFNPWFTLFVAKQLAGFLRKCKKHVSVRSLAKADDNCIKQSYKIVPICSFTFSLLTLSLSAQIDVIEGGKVGIGTETPTHKLDVIGSINFTDSLYQNGEAFSLDAPTHWELQDQTKLSTDYSVGIGTTEPQAALEVASTNAGFLPPRLSDEQINAIENPIPGTMVYNTDENCISLYNGTQWFCLSFRKLGDKDAPALSCLDILNKEHSEGDGLYWVDPDGNATAYSPFQAYCDMTSDGGGWMLVHKTNKSSGLDRTIDGYNTGALTNEAVNDVAILDLALIKYVKDNGLNEARVKHEQGNFFWKNADYYATDDHGSRPQPTTTQASLDGVTYNQANVSWLTSHSLCIGLNNFVGEHICIARWCCGAPNNGIWINGGAWGPGSYTSGTGWIR